jgi:flagellar biosynthetic protein FliO
VNIVETIGRMLLALGIVLGLMWALARWAKKPMGGKADRVLAVLAKQQVSRNASVAVVKVLDKALVLGVTDTGVQLLSETDLFAIEEALVIEKPAARTPRLTRSARAPRVLTTGSTDTLSADANGSASSAGSDELGGVSLSKSAGSDRHGDLMTKRTALDGSVLSPKMWKQLLNSARDLTVRR